jgi:hypothetical protein
MNAIRVRRRIDSDTLHLPELRSLIGHDVEIIVLHQDATPSQSASAFWQDHTVDELAAAQGITAAPTSIEQVFGDWTANDFDGFEETIAEWRESALPGQRQR